MSNTSISSALQVGAQTTPPAKPTVVGIYGVSGCGKSFLLNNLKKILGEEHFAFYDGSQVIGSVVPGGLSAFAAGDEQDQTKWREAAILKIGEECAETGRVGVVAGHLIFWPEEEELGKTV